jgi:uncharacterized protein (TIGR03437 family)
MDAAHRLIRSTGLLFAIGLLIAAPGWAQPTLVAPSNVSLSGSGGQLVNVTSSAAGTTEINFNTSTAYANDNGGVTIPWLGVSGAGTTPASLNFNVVTTAGLNQGTHQATVTLTPTSTVPAGAVPPAVTITVTFTSGSSGGGGGNGTLFANPNPINLSAATSGSPTTSVNVVISTSNTTAITIANVGASVSSGGTNWLSATLNGANSLVNGNPTSILVQASPFNLAAATYTGTVTVTPTVGTALTIPVNFTVGSSSGGNGNWTVTPGSLSFNFTTNSGVFPQAPLSATTTTGAGTYNVQVSSSNNWLLTSQTSQIVGSAVTISVGSNANALATGQYTGTVQILDPQNVLQATINVTLTVNGGSGSGGLVINPNPLTVNSAVNGSQQNQTVTVTSSTGGIFSASASSLPSWLTYNPPGTNNVVAGGSIAFGLNINPFGLASNTYTASLGITVGSQTGTLTVNLVVGNGGSGGGTTLVAPSSLTFSYQAATTPNNIAQQKLVIPAGSWTSTITTSNGGTWLHMSSSGGTSVPDSASSPTVTIDPTGLTVGSYTGNIAINSTSGLQNVSVSLNIFQGPVLVPTPGSLVFVTQTGTTTQGQNVFFSGTDPTVGPLNITATANNSWITITPTASSMTVFVDPTGMASGVYSGSITIQQANVANSPYTYPVVMVVNGGGGSNGPLTFNPGSLSFSSSNGSTPNSVNLQVGAAVATNFTYTTSVLGGVANWITISPTSGSGVTTTNITVGVNPAGLAAGTYNGSITFNTGVTQTVPITLQVGGSGGVVVTVSPTSLSFSSQVGSAAATQQLTVNSPAGAAAANFTVSPTTSSGGNWLSTDVSGTVSTPKTVNVTVNPAGLGAGTYNGNLAVQATGGSVVNVPVTMTLTAIPTVSATPTSLTFTYRLGDTAPAAQTVTVSGGSGLPFSATAVSTGNWLAVSPATGTTPGSVSVSINTANLTPGTLNGTVTIAGTGTAQGTTTVNVSLTVTAPLPTITKVTNAASFAAASISPGEIITVFGADPAHPIGPSTAVGLTLDASGAVSTTIGGVQVLVNGFACPMVFASATQVSAVVPYQLAPFTGSAVPVLVKFLGQTSNGLQVSIATTAPGIFTANSSGTGPGAILNSNNSVNAPNNPASRGDTVVLYLTGEGQTSPAGVTGKVTTVSSTPPLTPAPLLQVSITVGGQPAQFSFAGEAPGFVSGVMQLNVQLPANAGTGDLPVVVTIGGNPSQTGVTVSVK